MEAMMELHHLVIGHTDHRILPVHLSIPAEHKKWYMDDSAALLNEAMNIVRNNLEGILDAYFASLSKSGGKGGKKNAALDTFVGTRTKMLFKVRKNRTSYAVMIGDGDGDDGEGGDESGVTGPAVGGKRKAREVEAREVEKR